MQSLAYLACYIITLIAYYISYTMFLHYKWNYYIIQQFIFPLYTRKVPNRMLLTKHL